MKKTVATIAAMKDAEPIAMVTAYDVFTADIAEAAGIDILLVGDSVGMTHLGYRDTTRVRPREVLHHLRAVTSRTRQSLVVADMPFLSCHRGPGESVRIAGRFVQEGDADAVKVEGASGVSGCIAAIRAAGIPVMGHLGLLPQTVRSRGGYRYEPDPPEQEELLREARLLEDLGVFSLVLECVPPPLARQIRETLRIPVIGIGSGGMLDGQVLVSTDILGIAPESRPSFAKPYADLSGEMRRAFSRYCEEVKRRVYPAE